MNKDTHVYCTDCKYGEELIDTFDNLEPMPCACCSCFPLDPEDSHPFGVRKNYIALEPMKTIGPEIMARMPKSGKTFIQENMIEAVWHEIKSFFRGG
jgi:hypothetical protein